MSVLLGMSGDLPHNLSFLILDCAIKGCVVLCLAMVAVLLLRRDSAATRYHAWLMGMAAVIAVPLLCITLPQWRVLPDWTGAPRFLASEMTETYEVDFPNSGAAGELLSKGEAKANEVSVTSQPIATSTSRAELLPTASPVASIASQRRNGNWLSWIPLVWAVGFCVLLLRVLAARWLLYCAERRAKAIWPLAQSDQRPADAIVVAFRAAAAQLGLTSTVKILVESDKEIPLVWGIFQSRLLLPADARNWKEDQLGSVLLHELGHIKRRDPAGLLLAQFACAMHWFNPLVWVALRRMNVERERACDDLALASGVKASAYAGHLLEVVTQSQGSRWIESGALAVGRKSSLEQRLTTVLSEKHNRRRVSTALGGLALIVTLGVAIPVAMLRASETQEGAAASEPTVAKGGQTLSEPDEKPLKVGAESGASDATVGPEEKKPKEHALLLQWKKYARKNGDIPGGLIERLHGKVKEFIRNNTGDKSGDSYAKKMAPIEAKIDSSRDWKLEEVESLFNDITSVTTIPLDTTLEELDRQTFITGNPLPKELLDAPWGEAQENGLRMAWLLEPRTAEHRLDTPLKSRILLHNSGKETIVFRTRNWHQSSGHKAFDAAGEEVKIDSTYWTTLASLNAYRLAPGEFVELAGAGIGVGPNRNTEDWQGTRVGAWIIVTAGDEVTFQADGVPLHDWNEKPVKDAEPSWWPAFISERLGRVAPLPEAADERRQILTGIMKDLFGASPGEEELTAFASDRLPDALKSLQARLLARSGVSAFAGTVNSAVTKFRVLPVDPEAAKKPRTAKGPGRYTLGENIRLVVTRRPDGERIVNEASIHFYSPDPKKDAPGKPHVLKLPDGYDTWAAAWMRGGSVLWVMQKGQVRSYDFAEPTEVKETLLEDSKLAPQPILDALRGEVGVLDAPAKANGEEKKLPDDALWDTKTPFKKMPITIKDWSPEKNGLRIGMRAVAEEGWRLGKKVNVELWLHNVSDKDLSLVANPGRPDVGLAVAAKDPEGNDHWAASGNINIIAIPEHCMLPAGYVAKVKEFKLGFDEPGNGELAWTAPKFQKLKPGKYQLQCVWSDAHPMVAAPGDWTGEIATRELEFTLLGVDR